MRVTWYGIAILLVACHSPMEVGPLGSWGSTKVRLDLGPSGGKVTYPCATGTVSAGWTEATDDTWAATGTHTYLAPLAQGPDTASYSGHFNGNQLDFLVIVAAPQGMDTLGPFQVVRNGGGPSVPPHGCPV